MPERRSNCTHGTMTLLHGYFRCSICNRIPEFGWVYRCTEDSHDYEPDAATREETIIRFDRLMKGYTEPRQQTFAGITDGVLDFDEETNSKILKPQYTDEQVEKIRMQKENVQTTIHAQLASKGLGKPTAAPPVPAFSSIIAQSSQAEPLGAQPEILSQKVFGEDDACSWRCCHSCRMNFADRAWCHIDTIVSLSSSTVEELNRIRPDFRVSQVRHVSQLGTRIPPPPPKSVFSRLKTRQRFFEIDLRSSDSSGTSSSGGSTSSSESNFQNIYGFAKDAKVRHRVSTLFKNMLRGRTESVPYVQRGKENCRSLPSTSTNITEAKCDTPSTGLSEESFQAWAETTELPGMDGEDGLEEFGSEPVEVAGGIAVTEEAVIEGAPDLSP